MHVRDLQSLLDTKDSEKFVSEALDGRRTKDEIEDYLHTINMTIDVVAGEVEVFNKALDEMNAAIHSDDKAKLKDLIEEYGSPEQVKQCFNALKVARSTYDDIFDTLGKLNSDRKYFNKKRCFSNIRELLKQNSSVKIGQIERDAGIRLGYMSRLEKEGNTSDPSMEFVVSAALHLNVSLDTLVGFNLAGLTPHEQYLVKFFDKLKSDTMADKLDWNREKPDKLNDVCIYQGESEHPLFSFLDTDYREGARCVFVSKSFGKNTSIKDDCFNLRLKNGTTLYLMNIEKATCKSNDPDANAIEAWIWVPYKNVSALVTSRDASPIARMVAELYQDVKAQMEHPKINKEAMSAIEAFMKDDLEDDKLDDGGDITF